MNSDKYKTSIKLLGVKKRFWRDLYFTLMQASWFGVFFLFFCIYISLNTLFASAFILIPDSFNGGGDFFNAFSFSVQTFTTIGYGDLLPVSKMGNILVMLESTVGLIFTAITTGVVFTKLARPTAKISFSKNVLIHEVDGEKVLSCRLGNTRGNEITEAVVHMTALVKHVTKEGEEYSKILDMPLVRQASPFFRMTWTIRHPMDENSPIFLKEHRERLISIIVTIRGFDSIYSNKVSDRYEYLSKDILEDKYFEDMVSNDPDGTVVVDYSKFDKIKP